jgi:hypothetical protein
MKRLKTFLQTLALSVLLFTSPVWSADYYVDTTCTDTNVGSATVDGSAYDPATPACTGGSDDYYVTTADLNSSVFYPGDNVYFRAGQTWYKKLIVPSSGSYCTGYSLPSGTAESSVYTVKLNGEPVQVEDKGDHSYIWAACTGEVDVEITVNATVTSHTLSPASSNIVSSASGDKITFSVNRPRKLILHEVNAISEMLFLFIDPPEDNPPTIGGSVVDIINCGYTIDNTGVTDETVDIQACIDDTSVAGGTVYFTAGKYKAGQLKIKDDVDIYFAPGSRIIWTGAASYFDIEDLTTAITIYGRGLIDGPMVKVDNSDNITINDILITPHVNGWWALETEASDNFSAYNVKIINDWSLTSDCFDADYADNYLVDNSFCFGGDDAFVIHAKNELGTPNIVGVNFRNSIGYTGSSGLKIGSDTYNTLSDNATWENIDIVSYSHAAININPADGGNVTDFFFKNIRVEKFIDRGLGNEYVIRLEPWTRVAPPVSFLDDINIIRLIDTADQTSLIEGNFDDDVANVTTPNERINNVTIDGWYINDVLVEDTTDGSVTTDAYVSNLTFSNTEPSIVSINATTLYCSETRLDDCTFTVSRTGSTAASITVDYLVKGTATNGTDYTTITSPITLGIGVSSATLTIDVLADGDSTEYETVLISLENEVHETYGYILGANFHAQVTIFE